VRDCEEAGFRWIEGGDAANSVVAWVRFGNKGDKPVVMVANFTPVERPGYRIGLPQPGKWREVLNTDAGVYGGSNTGNMGAITAQMGESHGQPAHADVTLPPLGTVFLTPE